MWAPVVIETEIRDQRGGPTRGAQIGAAIRPFAKQRLNKPLGFAIGPRRVGARKPMAELPAAAHAGKASRFVSGAIVGEQAAHGHAPPAKPAEGVLQKRGAGAAALRAADFDKGEPGRIVDGHMHIFIADPAAAVGQVAVDPVADAADPPQWFDIEMQQVAGRGLLVALQHGRRVQPTDPIQARAPEHARDRRSRHADALTDFPRRRPLLSIGEDRRRARQVERARLAMRPRRPVLEAAITAPGAADPFGHGAHTQARRGGRRGLRPPLANDTLDQELAHLRGRLGITMKSHSEALQETLGWLGSAHCFQSPPNEQPV